MMKRDTRDGVKSSLRTFFFNLKEDGLAFLQRHEYPNVPDSGAFYTELQDMIASKKHMVQQDLGLRILLYAIEQDDRYDGVLLQGNTPDVLANFNDLYDFMYLDQPTLFLNSLSNFDNQLEVQRFLNNNGGLSFHGKDLTNYKFIESKGESADSILIQISDFVVNILSYLFDYLMAQPSLEWIALFMASLDDVPKQNFEKFRFLLSSSVRENFAFRIGVSTQQVRMLLDGLDLSADEYNQFIYNQDLSNI